MDVLREEALRPASTGHVREWGSNKQQAMRYIQARSLEYDSLLYVGLLKNLIGVMLPKPQNSMT